VFSRKNEIILIKIHFEQFHNVLRYTCFSSGFVPSDETSCLENERSFASGDISSHLKPLKSSFVTCTCAKLREDPDQSLIRTVINSSFSVPRVLVRAPCFPWHETTRGCWLPGIKFVVTEELSVGRYRANFMELHIMSRLARLSPNFTTSSLPTTLFVASAEITASHLRIPFITFIWSRKMIRIY